ncbi:uncharacterized protein LOC122627417, partial [Vespula pensylvanica]|uniref:uncharacterized protein LOC122627417 n=1 Tax=Vespula pensylvanica TaxID=30213 RepID=UPI001CBA3AA6
RERERERERERKKEREREKKRTKDTSCFVHYIVLSIPRHPSFQSCEFQRAKPRTYRPTTGHFCRFPSCIFLSFCLSYTLSFSLSFSFTLSIYLSRERERERERTSHKIARDQCSVDVCVSSNGVFARSVRRGRSRRVSRRHRFIPPSAPATYGRACRDRKKERERERERQTERDRVREID